MAINTDMVQALGALQGLLGNPLQDLGGLIGLTTQMANQELAQSRDAREQRQSEAAIKHQDRMAQIAAKDYALRLEEARSQHQYQREALKEQQAARKSSEAIAGNRLRAEQDTAWQKQSSEARQARLDRAGNAAAILSRMPGSEKAALAALASLFEADDVSGLGAFLRNFEPERFGDLTDEERVSVEEIAERKRQEEEAAKALRERMGEGMKYRTH